MMQNIFDRMNLGVNSIVIILINNKSAQVINEVDIKISIRMYFKPVYDKDNSEMEKFSETLNLKKIETLMENVHTAWYSHLFKNKDQILLLKRILFIKSCDSAY